MPNIGEEICGEYLRNILKCEFITYNVTNPDIQGEIDVVGINLQAKNIYVCEVATHTGGLQYVTDKRPEDYNRFMSKFKKDINYANKYFNNYEIILMLWSPIVKISTDKAKYNTLRELDKLQNALKENFKLNLELIINQKYQDCINELRDFALSHTAMFNSSAMRLFQIEKNLEKHLSSLRKRDLI